MSGSRTEGGVAVVSFSPIVSDRRVLRQCALLVDMGHPPLLIAHADPGDHVPYDLAAWPIPRVSTLRRLWTTARQLPAHLGLAAAKAGFWAEPRNRWALKLLRAARPRLVVANDWQALVVGAAYKRESGARLHYDSHEFATREFEERAWWRLVYQPMVRHLERDGIHLADTVSTVGPKLAEAIRQEHGLAAAPVVIRSIPDRIALPDVATSWPLRLLYHGVVLPHRGIELVLDSMPDWAVPHRLTIRGNGPAPYLAGLRALVAERGLAGRVDFEPAVPADQVMPVAARTADIGLFTPPLDTEQRSLSLPNKLFEYIGAGLAVIVSPGDDLRQVTEQHGVGLVLPEVSAAALTREIDALSPARVERWRQLSRQAARDLCWDKERIRLAELLEKHIASG